MQLVDTRNSRAKSTLFRKVNYIDPGTFDGPIGTRYWNTASARESYRFGGLVVSHQFSPRGAKARYPASDAFPLRIWWNVLKQNARCVWDKRSQKLDIAAECKKEVFLITVAETTNRIGQGKRVQRRAMSDISADAHVDTNL
jgi:hypothetical protein